METMLNSLGGTTFVLHGRNGGKEDWDNLEDDDLDAPSWPTTKKHAG